MPTNAVLTAHYAPTAQYLGEEVTLEHEGVGKDTVTATFDDTQGLLSVSPPEPLVPGDHYVIAWPGLRGIGTASIGKDAEVAFEAGDGPDETAPDFEGLLSVEWDALRGRDGCTDHLEDRFAFDVVPGTARDDASGRSLSLVVFQTKGPHFATDSAPVPVGDFAFPDEPGAKVRVELPIHDATGPVCFAGLVRDLAGHASNGAEREVCTTTTAPPFFYGCRIGRVRNGAAGVAIPGGAVATTVLALSLLARRRHRKRA